RRERHQELVPDGERKVELALRQLDRLPGRGRLLEEDPDRALDVRIGRAFAVVVVVVQLFREIERSRQVEGARMIGRQRLRQLDVSLRRERIRATGNARLEEEGVRA